MKMHIILCLFLFNNRKSLYRYFNSASPLSPAHSSDSSEMVISGVELGWFGALIKHFCTSVYGQLFNYDYLFYVITSYGAY